jgi:HD-GYP domain-containing protein (c-di-GMP phosphodiesterase class II)
MSRRHASQSKLLARNVHRRLTSLWNALEHGDPDLAAHGRSTAIIATQLAHTLRPDPRTLAVLKWAGKLHDIGKTVLPRTILDKPGSLTRGEWKTMRSHPAHSFVILHQAEIPADLMQLVLLHHERFDGSGYPVGLKGEDIPLTVRILSIADAYSALTSRRPYRDCCSSQEALAILTKDSGIAFDPDIIRILIQIVKGANATNNRRRTR